MSLSVDIPRIDITPDAEEDDDHIPSNISEALTDVEDLYDDPAPPQIKKKNKLKIKLSDNAGVTDLEDFEASSDDDGTQIIKHRYPVVMSDLDIEAPLTEESYRKQTSKGKRRMKTEFATKQKSFYQSEEESHDEGVVTDSEAYETENEPYENIPETEYNLNLYRTTENLVADNMANNKPAINNHLVVFSNQDGSTDVEVLRSDSDSDNAEMKKGKTKRRRHRGQRKPSATDLEEVYFSDETLAPKASRKFKRKQKLTKCNTLPLDSENEEGEKLPFPLCKRVAKKNMPSLIIPDEFDLNFQTDVEDIEADQDLDVPGLIIDEEALDEQLKQIASGYGVVKEEHCNLKKETPYRKPIIGVDAIDIFTENCDTDDEEFQSELASGNNNVTTNADNDDYESEDVDDVKLFLRDDHADYKIKFSPSLQSLKLNASRSLNNLALPLNNEDPLTDCEDVDEPYCKIPVAFVKQSETDEEEFVIDEDVKFVPFKDIQLPPPTRNLVLVQENDALVPTVRILPLDSLDYNNADDNLDFGEQTDEESVSEAFDALDVEQPLRGPTPDLPYLDGDLINVLESVDKCKSPMPIESITDTEEVDLEPIRRKRAPKFKFMYEKSLSAKNKLESDLEIRPLSPQPLIDSVVPKESSGPFSIIDKLELNKFSLTPVTTDSEDMMASAEEDLDKEVMYLKGGGYNNADYDVECLEIDFKRITFGYKEWDDSKKPKHVADQATLDAAQQEISCGLTHQAEPIVLTTAEVPQPKPRTTKPSDIPLDFSKALPKNDKILSPVRDDLLDNDEDDFATYSDRKKFWENVGKDQKRLSLHEVTVSENVIAKKRLSIQQDIIGQPPIPKPRASHQEPEKEKTETELKIDKAIEEENIHAQEELTSIIENIENPEKIMTEYQASFMPPADRKEKFKQQSTDSIDSDKAQKGSSQLIEHTGYISDSEDVENVISDSEIEDRVPQIRERQMSVFTAPTQQRRTIYERSASLPTEDLYEVSRNLKHLKEKYEQKIREDMIEDTDNEEDSSPERKTLATLQEERISAIRSQVDQAMAKIGEEVQDEETSFVPIKTTPQKETIHVDKSELEKPEKIPEITFTLSGKQRRISEESDESPVKQSEEHVQETLWEATVETQPDFIEKADSFDQKEQILKTEDISEIEELPSVEEDEFSQLEHVLKRQSIPDFEKFELQYTTDDETSYIKTDATEADFSSIKENISEKLTKEIHEKLNEKLKAQDIMIEKAVSEEVDDKTLDELKELMVEEALEELHQQREESDLGSEIHLDQSDSAVSDRIKSESHSEIEKIILDTFQHMKVDPDEAKKIASQLIQEIESEIQNRGELSKSEATEMFNPEMSSYIKQLAETNGLDEREIELVESVLARRQRELAKLARGDTQASSMEITDEDLRYSGGELADYTHTLEQQMGQLEAEKVALEYLDQEKEFIDEIHKTEKVFSKDSETFEDARHTITKKDVKVSIEDSVKGEKTFTEHKNVILEEDETISESSLEEHGRIKTHIDSSVLEVSQAKTKDSDLNKIKTGTVTLDKTSKFDVEKEYKEIKTDKMFEETKKEQIEENEKTQVKGKYVEDQTSKQVTDSFLKELKSTTEKEYDETQQKDEKHHKEELNKLEKLDDGTQISTNISVDKQHYTTSTEIVTKDKTIVESKTIDTTSSDLSKLLETIQRTSSSDSKSSLDSKSPSDKAHVILRKTKSELDSSSSSSKKPDRRSGIEFETYSSSGESHYQSFDMDSAKSRPCSSDVEAIVAASSEYDTALTSTQEFSAKSTDYHTAISSLSSKESMKSLDSESSGNLASVEVSEHSETLVPSTSDDILDGMDDAPARPSRQVSTTDNDSMDISEDNDLDLVMSKMKRSAEMTFQPEPKVLSSDLDTQYGHSLDDGSILSMSSTSSTGAQRTVIEVSERHEEDTIRGSQESLPLTPTLFKSDISTSTPQIHEDLPIEHVTITTSNVKEDGVHCASTQITSETSESSKPEGKKGHKRSGSTMMGISLPTRKEKNQESEKDIDEKELFDNGDFDSAKHTDSERPLSLAETSSITESIEPSEYSVSPKPKDISLDLQRKHTSKDVLEKRDSHGTSSEKSSFEEAEAEAAFNMVAHVSPAHKVKQIVPILEDEDAEKHELELRERQRQELEEKRAKMRDISPGFIPDITVTDMTPESEHHSSQDSFEKIVQEEAKQEEGSPPIEDDILTSSMMQSTLIESTMSVTTTITESITSEAATVVEALKDDVDSQSSDSFEMLEKPDIIDDFVVIEEVGKEAQEFDTEGQSVKIDKGTKLTKKHDEEIEKYLAHSAPTPLTGARVDEFGFDFEDSPPKPEGSISTREYGYEYDKELEANKKWIEQQFQGDQAAMLAAGYGYEMEFERGPLEDIKEEDINDFAASSYGSQKESGGSVKDSYSSTPDYDVLAGRKYFTRTGEQDDISMNSLQEFENLEQAMSLEMRKFHQGQGSDSSSSGSSKTRFHHSKNNTGDDISVSSLKEFEGLEHACIQAHKIEVKAKEEEAMLLAQIEEGQESIASESESCETTGTEKKVTDTDEEEDYEKRMFEIDEIIKQAQTNVERFIDLREMEKTESLGRGDSIEEVSRVPDLELDAPVKSTIKVQWKEGDDVMITSTDSLDLKQEETRRDSTDSLDAQPVAGDVMTASTDSIEFQAQKPNTNIMTDSIEIREEKSYMVSSDSLELGQATSSGLNIIQTDSIDEDGSRIGGHDHSSASTGKDFSSSAKEDIMEISSSTATHATMQYETDSVFSGSFTSAGSNTMVSSTDTIDPVMIDVGAAARKVWFDEDFNGRRVTEYVEESSKPYVSETYEPTDDEQFSHIVHRKVELAPEVRKVTFTGPDADEQLKRFMQDFNEGEEVEETQEVDEYGNIHTKRVVQKRFVVKSDEPGAQVDIEDYFRRLNQPDAAPELTRLTHSITGAEQAHSTSSQQATSSSKAETEDSHDKGAKDKSKKVSDQHQLSDEMQQLLKEMEKESKQ